MQLIALSLPTILMRLRAHTEITFIVCALAVYGAVVWLKEKWRVRRTRNWPRATGAVSDIKSEKVDGGLNGVDYFKVTFTYAYSPEQAGTVQQHTGTYSFNCVSEDQANGAAAALVDKTVSVHYQPGNERKSVLWEDEVWDVWWDAYWQATHSDVPSEA